MFMPALCLKAFSGDALLRARAPRDKVVIGCIKLKIPDGKKSTITSLRFVGVHSVRPEKPPGGEARTLMPAAVRSKPE